jgi:hypothetical protein
MGLGIIWAIIMFVFVVILIFPLGIGVTTFIRFKKNELGRLAGCLILQPVITYPLWLIYQATIQWNINLTWIAVISILPDFISTLLIVFFFRKAFVSKSEGGVGWSLLVLDVLRWLNLYYLARNPYLWAHVVLDVSGIGAYIRWVTFLCPSIFAILVMLIISIKLRGQVAFAPFSGHILDKRKTP